MLQLLIVASILAVGTSEPDLQNAESASSVLQYNDHQRYDNLRDADYSRGHPRDQNEHNEYPQGPRKAHVSDDTLRKQYKIIENVYSPDYYEPSMVLDFRYLKTGGRQYVRGPGGQIIILPKGVKSDERTDFEDFDSLIEFLRLRNKQLQDAKIQRLEDERREYQHYDDHRAHSGQRGPGVRYWV